MLKILFVTSEATPLIKTGGLADVSAALPGALKALGHDVRILLPAYREAITNAAGPKPMAHLTNLPGAGEVTVLESHLPGSGVKVWLLDHPPAYDRPGHPYLNADGGDWHDNGERFALLARAAVAIARDDAGLDWRPDVVHCNDWQTGLVPTLLAGEIGRPVTVFTVHNLSYQGLFPWDTFVRLGLPAELWSMDRLEFFGRLSFIKGGLVFADRLTVVSPTYAREILTPEYGCGLDGLLRHRRKRLHGILNGVDYRIWDPAVDPMIPERYGTPPLIGKAANKSALQAELGLPERPGSALIGMISRLVDQKGVDLVLDVIPKLLRHPMQMVVLGTGEKHYEQAFRNAAADHPDRLAVHIGYDERLAHWIEAAADIFLMPSRFEPCGLNQIYSLRYGTLPVVRRTGGLADTVVDATNEHLKKGTATGFVFVEATPRALIKTLNRALALYDQPLAWEKMITAAMGQDFSWGKSARKYVALYRKAIKTSRGVTGDG